MNFKLIICHFTCLLVISLGYTQPFETGTNLFSIGTGWGIESDYEYDTGWPLAKVSYERGIGPMIGPGFFGAGVSLGYRLLQGSRLAPDPDDGNIASYQNSWHYRYAGGRLTYHFNLYIIEEIDLYLGAEAFYKSVVFRSTYDDEFTQPRRPAWGGFDYQALAGFRYYFGDRFAGWIEGGYGISYVAGGLSWRW